LALDDQDDNAADDEQPNEDDANPKHDEFGGAATTGGRAAATVTTRGSRTDRATGCRPPRRCTRCRGRAAKHISAGYRTTGHRTTGHRPAGHWTSGHRTTRHWTAGDGPSTRLLPIPLERNAISVCEPAKTGGRCWGEVASPQFLPALLAVIDIFKPGSAGDRTAAWTSGDRCPARRWSAGD